MKVEDNSNSWNIDDLTEHDIITVFVNGIEALKMPVRNGKAKLSLYLNRKRDGFT